jgi:hypothetical protein
MELRLNPGMFLPLLQKYIETDFIIFVPFIMLGFKYCLQEFAFKVTFYYYNSYD